VLKEKGQMDELTAQDWAMYGGEGEDPLSFSYSHGMNGGGGGADGDFVVRKKKKSVSFPLKGNQSEDVVLREIHHETPDLATLFDGVRTNHGAPIYERVENKRVIPYNVQHGASLLLDAHNDQDIRLGYEALKEIQMLAACDDEFTRVDPFVVIYDTFTTGTCKIYVEEVVPISDLLLARFFDFHYKVVIMEDIESNPRNFKAIKARPYVGKTHTDVQSLGCSDMVKQRLSAEQTKLVQIYMLRMGPQSSSFVCDFDWLETQTKAMGKVLTQKSNPL
jgi:hypothetical protein